MSVPFISFEAGEAALDWLGLTRALEAGHQRPKADIGDTFLYRDPDTLLSRAAWIDGMGALVKTATVFPKNTAKSLPSINGGVTLFDDETGRAEAFIDFHLVTKWKTAGDSLLAALKLAPPDVRQILIIGAGTVSKSLIEAFGAGYPDAQFLIWNRSAEKAQALAETYHHVSAAADLEEAVGQADIILTATMTTEPVLKGAWLRPGQHVNMIGAYRGDMREADDEALRRSEIFVDSFDTTIGHIGEIEIPLSEGTIQRDDLLADFYDLDRFRPAGPDRITLFKNGGGAHLDLMTSRYILDRWTAQ